MRKILALLAMLTLPGCNEVHSVRPLAVAPDGAPRFRPGLWVGVDSDCVFDANQPVKAWPACASGFAIDTRQIRGVREEDRGDLTDYRLSGRFPTVVQARVLRDAGGPAPEDEAAAKLGPYQYLGLRVLRTDRAGRMLEAGFWNALCGPPPPPAKPGETSRYVTAAPLPGLTIVGDACTADTLDAVRGSVIASQAWSPPQVIRWVRGKPWIEIRNPRPALAGRG